MYIYIAFVGTLILLFMRLTWMVKLYIWQIWAYFQTLNLSQSRSR